MSDELRPPPPMTEFDEEPKAVIERLGSRKFSVTIEHGFMAWGPHGIGWTVHGSLERAQRKAQRELDRYKREFTEKRERWEIT